MTETFSDSAAHTHNVSIILDGCTSAEDMKTFMKNIMNAPDDVNIDIIVGDGKATASLPICCWYNPARYGTCWFGVPGPCSPEHPGCPA